MFKSKFVYEKKKRLHERRNYRNSGKLFTGFSETFLITQKYHPTPHPSRKKKDLFILKTLCSPGSRWPQTCIDLSCFPFKSFWRGVSGNHGNPLLDFLPWEALFCALPQLDSPYPPFAAENKCDSNHADCEWGIQ